MKLIETMVSKDLIVEQPVVEVIELDWSDLESLQSW